MNALIVSSRRHYIIYLSIQNSSIKTKCTKRLDNIPNYKKNEFISINRSVVRSTKYVIFFLLKIAKKKN